MTKLTDRINNALEDAMTVGELVEVLSKLDPNLLVVKSHSTPQGYLEYHSCEKTYRPRRDTMLLTAGKDYTKKDILLVQPYAPFHRSTIMEKEAIIL